MVLVSGVGPDLGRAIALRSAEAGADVVLAARTASRLDEVAKEVTGLGRRAVAVPADITDADSAAHLAEAALAAFGQVDSLVHNAFTIPPLTSLADADLDTIRAAFETNVLAALRLTRLLVPALAASGGSVVMINSAVLRHSRVSFAGYKMAKSALLALADSLATELGPRGIRVNSVAPGWIWGDTLKWYFGYLAGRTRGGPAAGLRRDRRQHRLAQASGARARSRTRWCSWPPGWPGRSPASAWTSTAASSTTEREP